jgi:hypothetical protein
MNTDKKTMLTLLTLLALTGPAFAESEGGDVGGGSNSCRGQVVESTKVNLDTMRGYPVFQEKMRVLRDAAPGLADIVEHRLDQLHWHEVSCPLPQVSQAKTGLGHDWFQDCRQEENSDEIFCDKAFRNAATEKVAGEQLMHEALMSLLEKKISKAVRPAVESLFDEPADPVAIQGVLTRSGFGVYVSLRQQPALRAYARARVVRFFDSLLRETLKSCAANDDFAHVKLNLLYWHGKIPQGVRSNSWSVIDNLRSPFVNLRDFWEADFDNRIYSSDADNPLMNACMTTGYQYSIAKKPVTTGFSPDLCQEVLRGAGDPTPTGELEKKLRGTAYENAVHGAANDDALTEFTRVVAELAKDDAFIDVMALVRKDRTAYKLPIDLSPTVLDIYRRTEARSEIKGDPHAKREQLCQDIDQLARNLRPIKGASDREMCRLTGDKTYCNPEGAPPATHDDVDDQPAALPGR